VIAQARPYDLPCVQIKKSDDLDNAFAKVLVLQTFLAQAVAMQIISTNKRSAAARPIDRGTPERAAGRFNAWLDGPRTESHTP